MDTLFAEFPPVVPQLFCNPLYCSNSNIVQNITAQELEDALLVHFKSSRLHSVMITTLWTNPVLFELLGTLLSTFSSSDINAAENREPLKTFFIKFKKAVEVATSLGGTSDISGRMIIYLLDQAKVLLPFAQGECKCFFARKVALEGMKKAASETLGSGPASTKRLLARHFESREDWQQIFTRVVAVKGWTSVEAAKLNSEISVKVIEIFEKEIETGQLSRWFALMDLGLGGIRMLHHARLIRDSCTPRSDPSDPEGDEIGTVWFELGGAMVCLEKYRIHTLREAMKTCADRSAKELKYTLAISLYNVVNLMPIEDSLKLQSLANCAAIRLRLFESDPSHLPYVILECSFALAIDPNYVKALFRRGLALALLKKWNEAIVDFERAIELDPRSPAVKELAVARRQVTRRIGV